MLLEITKNECTIKSSKTCFVFCSKDVVKDYKKWIYIKIASHVSSGYIEFSFAKLYLGHVGVSCIHF